MNDHTAQPVTPHETTVTVIGAGVSGLTVAHELAVRGFDVTIVESATEPDNRRHADGSATNATVEIGGLAKTQFDTGLTAYSFPQHPAHVTPEDGAEAANELLLYGEHGYRFFPSYYRHLFDTMQRTPVYDRGEQTRFTTFDNVLSCTTQATAGTPEHPLVAIPRDATDSALVGDQTEILTKAGYEPTDIAYLAERMLQFMASCPARRQVYEQVSSYDFFVGIDEPGEKAKIKYSPEADEQLNYMPKVLVAFDGKYGDARTNIDNWAQMLLNALEQLPKTDGILNGPTTTAWLDHWRRYLEELGVRFVEGVLEQLGVDADRDDKVVAHIKNCRFEGKAVRGKALLRIKQPDYVVVATDVVTAELVTRDLPQVGVPAGLRGYTTTKPPATPPGGPATPAHPITPPPAKAPEDDRFVKTHEDHDWRDPYTSAGLEPWDRLQTLTGIQYFFDTEFDLLQGRIYFGNTEWGISSVSQVPYWTKKPNVRQNGYASIMSIDIGNATTKSRHTGKTFMESTREEIALEVWRQIKDDLGLAHQNVADILPTPRWYALDQNLEFCGETGRLLRNMAPYLVPIVDDWNNRPGPEPWKPGGEFRPTLMGQNHVWQAGHGGAWVHFHSLVFAGTYLKTFTRLTTMESANESARHAVNAILDHWLWDRSKGQDQRAEAGLDWLVPYGYPGDFHSNPVRQPTPIGDYCYIEDMEDHEIPSLQPIRDLDALLFEHGLPHPFVLNGLEASTAISSQISSFVYSIMGSGQGGTDPLYALLRKYREWLEHIVHDLGGQTATKPPGTDRPGHAPPHRQSTAPPSNPWPTWGLAGLLDPRNAAAGPTSPRPVSPEFQRLSALIDQIVQPSPFGWFQRP